MWLLIVATMTTNGANWNFHQFRTEADCKTAIVGMYQIAARVKAEAPSAMCLPSGFVDVRTKAFETQE